MEKGVIFSMASDLELEAAETLLSIFHGFGWVRFLKTGGDACSAACRVARAITGRNLILTEGYHGWHDTFFAVQQGNGVPESIRQVSKFVSTKSLAEVSESIVPHLNQAAAVIISPEYGRGEIYRYLSEKCHQTGALLIFDEVVTGCRVSLGGVQELERVRCDMVVMAKAIANGYPVSAIVGKEELRSAFDQTIITMTHGGETLSMAALVATITKLKHEKVLERIAERGRHLMAETNRLFKDFGLPLAVEGFPAMMTVIIKETGNNWLREALSQQLLSKGVFERSRWFLCDAHREAEIDKVLSAVEAALKVIKRSGID